MIDEIFAIWTMGVWFSLLLQLINQLINQDGIEDYRMVFWPIILIKWLIRSFIKALKD